MKEKKITIPKPENFNAITSKGVEAKVEGKKVKVVSPGYLKNENISIPDGSYGSAAETVVFVLVDSKLAGYIALLSLCYKCTTFEKKYRKLTSVENLIRSLP